MLAGTSGLRRRHGGRPSAHRAPGDAVVERGVGARRRRQSCAGRGADRADDRRRRRRRRRAAAESRSRLRVREGNAPLGLHRHGAARALRQASAPDRRRQRDAGGHRRGDVADRRRPARRRAPRLLPGWSRRTAGSTIAQELEAIATRVRDAAQERFQTGAAPRLEALQARLALAQAQNDVAAARGERQRGARRAQRAARLSRSRPRPRSPIRSKRDRCRRSRRRRSRRSPATRSCRCSISASRKRARASRWPRRCAIPIRR